MRLPIFVSLALLQATPVFAGWLRLPNLDKKPVGMELAYSGTTIHSASGMVDAASLIMGDLKKSAKLPSGRSEAVLRFAKQSFIQHLSFVSDDIEGSVSLFISPDNQQWTSLGQTLFGPAKRMVNVDVGRAQGKYVKLSFELSKGGAIRGVQVVGSDSDANYIVMQDERGSGAPVNFATGIGGGRLIFLSDNVPGTAKDAQLTNCFKFSASGSKYRTAVYDLGQERTLNEFGSLHSNLPAQLEVFAFAALPEKENWRGRPAFDAAIFDTVKPVALAKDKTGRGYVTVKPAEAVKARYVALRWETEVSNAPFEVYGVAVSGMASIFFQNVELTATTFRDAEGHIVTKLSSAPAGESEVELVKFATAAQEEFGRASHGLALNNASNAGFGLLFGSSFYKGSGGLNANSGRRKEEGEGVEGEEDPDADPPSVHIIWCPEASP